jgi:hypothetical protein
MIKSDQLGGTNKGEIQRVKKHHGVFTRDVFFQVKSFVEIVVAHHGNSVEIGGGFADEYSHVHLLVVGYIRSRNLDFCCRRVNLLQVVGFDFAEAEPLRTTMWQNDLQKYPQMRSIMFGSKPIP